MFRLGLVRWLRHASDDVGRALRSIVSPWADLAAVKTTQTDIINALSSQQADIADALASIRTFGAELDRLNVRMAEQDELVRGLSARPDTVSRKLAEGSRPDKDRRPNGGDRVASSIREQT